MEPLTPVYKTPFPNQRVLAAIPKRSRKIGTFPPLIALSGDPGVTGMPPNVAVSREKDATVRPKAKNSRHSVLTPGRQDSL